MNGIDRPIRYRPSPDPYASSTDPEYLQNGVGRIYDLRRLAMAVTSPLADDAWVTEPHGHGKGVLPNYRNRLTRGLALVYPH